MKVTVGVTGFELLNDPRLNKGTAFTEGEREIFSLHGLLPPHIGTLEDQVVRRRQALARQDSAFARYSFMRDLQDANETLFYALIARNIRETLPIVYTPTVGEGCQRFSEIWHKARGLFVSYPNRDRIDRIFAHSRYDTVKCIVVSDGERILGLGDQGAGGMGIPIGKMALYTALAGIPPEACLPILLDVGTDNPEKLADPLYVGWSHKRVRGAEYDGFVEAFVTAVKRRWPDVLLQWEDFAGANAARLLERYRSRLCTFNDDIQGTAAVASAAILSALSVTGEKLPAKLGDQRIVFVGFGSAGIGIANLLVSLMREEGLDEKQAHSRIYAVDLNGLLVEGDAALRPDQAAFARPRGEGGETGLSDVVRNARATVLIGVSGQPGIFTEEVVRTMAANTERPIIFPLSNPTSRSEGIPRQLLEWSDGRALIATGSPFEPVPFRGKIIPIDHTDLKQAATAPEFFERLIAKEMTAEPAADAVILISPRERSSEPIPRFSLAERGRAPSLWLLQMLPVAPVLRGPTGVRPPLPFSLGADQVPGYISPRPADPVSQVVDKAHGHVSPVASPLDLAAAIGRIRKAMR